MLDAITGYNSNFMFELTRGQKIAKFGIRYCRQYLCNIHNCCICRLIIVNQTIHDIAKKGPLKWMSFYCPFYTSAPKERNYAIYCFTLVCLPVCVFFRLSWNKFLFIFLSNYKSQMPKTLTQYSLLRYAIWLDSFLYQLAITSC